MPGQRLVQGFQRQCRLARPRHARNAGHDAHRKIDSHVVEVVRGRALNPDLFPGLLAPLCRHFDPPLAGEILPGDRFFGFLHLRWRAFGHNGPAMHPGAGAHIDQIVCGANGVFVVLDHQHRIPQIAQPRQGFQQAVVVTLVEPDGGFVEHVQNTGQAGANL